MTRGVEAALPITTARPAGPQALDALIEEARRRQRRRRLLVGAVVAATVAAAVGARQWRPGAHHTATAEVRQVTPAQATACLETHGVLVQPNPPIRDMRNAPAIQASFALVPGRRHDFATIAFERDNAAAAAVAAALIERFQPKLPTFGNYLTVKNNAVVAWDSETHGRKSESTILACL